MMRRLALCKASHQLAVQPALHFSRHSASLALCCAVRAQHCAAVRHDDSTTWPEHWTAVDIEGLLRGNLATSRLAPNYGSLATLHRLGDRKSLNLLLREYVRPAAPQEVDLEKFLATHVNNVIDSAAMPLQERALDAMSRALSPAIGSELRNIAFCSSPRGTGKTQFLKHFVFTKRAEAMRCGRVIVRCCDKTAHETKDKSRPSWIAQVLQAQHSSTANSIDDGLCELIRTHVECVTGTQQTSSNYCDPHTAYATWMSETARHFKIPKGKSNVDPLIILDTCEILSEHDHKSLVHKHSGKPNTLLEAFCLAVPAPHSILAIGCNSQIDAADPALSAVAAVTKVGPLLPLSEAGFRSAVEQSWKVDVDESMVTPLHNLAGGVPRLLRLAQMRQPQTISLASGSVDAFKRVFEVYSATARAQYPVQPALFPEAYTCLLASSTKARVRGGDVIPVNPSWRGKGRALTYDEATTLSMGSHDPSSGRFMVAPVTFGDVVVTKPNAPILPSQLHPFLDADVVARFGRISDVERQTLFKKAFLHAVYARYLLAHWEMNSSPWVSLAKVFEGSVHPKDASLLDALEVNLSNGARTFSEAVPKSVTAVSDDDNLVDAFLWCRLTDAKNATQVISMRLHVDGYQHELPSTSTQLLSIDSASHCHIDVGKAVVLIDTCAMSSISWLKNSYVDAYL